MADILVNRVFSRFGPPTIIHSDKGRNFESNLMQEVFLVLWAFKGHEPLPITHSVMDRLKGKILHCKKCLLHLCLSIRMIGIPGSVLQFMRIIPAAISPQVLVPMI